MYRIINVPLQKLREFEDNPRNNDVAVDKVKASIERVGFMFPIVIDMNHAIVCGHTRRLACVELGIKTVPCIMVDDLTEEQVNLFRLVDNKTSEYASWDYEKLAAELKQIDVTLSPNEFIINSFDFDLEPTEFEDVPAEVPIKTFNFMGDGFRRGQVRQAEHGYGDEDSEEYGDAYDDDDDDDGDGEYYSGDVSEDGDDGSTDETGSGTDDADGAAARTMAVVKQISKDVAESGEATQFGEQKSGSSTAIHIFRCGTHRFIISEIEEERLMSAYTKYMGEVYPDSTFIKYLLGGQDNVEIQS